MGTTWRKPASTLVSGLTAILVLAACSSGSSDPATQPAEVITPAGNLSVSYQLLDSQSPSGAPINCADANASVITAQVLNAASAVVAETKFACVDGRGLVSGIPPGSAYRVLVMASPDGNTQLFRGEQFNVAVTDGTTTQVGPVELRRQFSSLSIRVTPTQLVTTGPSQALIGGPNSSPKPIIDLNGLLTSIDASRLQCAGYEADGMTPLAGVVTVSGGQVNAAGPGTVYIRCRLALVWSNIVQVSVSGPPPPFSLSAVPPSTLQITGGTTDEFTLAAIAGSSFLPISLSITNCPVYFVCSLRDQNGNPIGEVTPSPNPGTPVKLRVQVVRPTPPSSYTVSVTGTNGIATAPDVLLTVNASPSPQPPALRIARERHTASLTLLDASFTGVVVVGGRAGSGLGVSTIEVYDPAQGTWGVIDTPTPMPPRFDHAVTGANTGGVFVTGGYEGGTFEHLSHTLLIRSLSGTGNQATPPLLQARSNHVVYLNLTNLTFYVIGGRNQGGLISSIESYRHAIDSAWRQVTVPGVPFIPRIDFTGTRFLDTHLLIVGGRGADGNYLESVQDFNGLGPLTNESPIKPGRALHTTTLLDLNQFLVVGGETTQGCNERSAFILDSSRSVWSPAGMLKQGRCRHTATLMPDGKVVVIGGRNGDTDLASVEVYDPATNTWSDAGALAIPRSNHTATRLPNGQILVTGGSNQGTPLSSAELY